LGFAQHLWAWLENIRDPKARLLAEVLVLKTEVARLQEEMAVKDSRMGSLPAKRRSQYSPDARLRVLALKAARCWSLAATAARFQVTSATVASWVAASTDAHSTLLKQRQAVNSFPDFIVQQLEVTVPMLGRRKVPEYLGRVGLALSASTVARRLKQAPVVPPPDVSPSNAAVEVMKPAGKKAQIVARYPGHVWGMDITLVPTTGFCVPWWPRVFPPIWPFTGHVLLVLDHFSGAVVHTPYS